MSALSKLITSVETGEEITAVIRQALTQLTMKNLENECVDVPVSVKLWQVSGCHELLASLGKYFLFSFLKLLANFWFMTDGYAINFTLEIRVRFDGSWH